MGLGVCEFFRTSMHSHARSRTIEYPILMQTLHRHVLADFLIYAMTAAAALVFVVCVALVFGTANLMTQGVGMRAFLKVIALGVPSVLPFAIPVSLLTASLLLFGRLSADGEITALKACGVSLWSLLSPLLLLALLMTLFCAWLNNRTVPRNRRLQRQFLYEIDSVSPLDFFPAGQTISDFPGLTVWIERIEDDELFNIRIYDQRHGQTSREIHARSGAVYLEAEEQNLMLDLYDVTIDPFDDKRPGPAVVGKWTVKVADTGQRRGYRERPADYEIEELLENIRALDAVPSGQSLADRNEKRMTLRVELNKRLALAAACFAFVLLGAPLGIKAHRKESSVGGAISLAVLLVFYVFLVLAESLRGRPEFRPDLLIWLPVLLALILGRSLIRRADG